MIELNNIELDVAREILNIGLSKSADSLSFFIKDQVFVKTFDLYLGDADTLESYLEVDHDKELSILTTELKGELTGDCFLIFDENEVEELLKVSLPASILDNPDQKAEMGKAILLELDNIVAASVITQFSNILDCRVYGDVPNLEVVASDELATIIKQKANLDYYLCFKVDFHTNELDLKPKFIWGLGEKFLEGVKEIALEGTDSLEKYKAAKG